jgi:chromosome segregation ATPase
LKTELAGVRGQLDAARADAEAQKQAAAAGREEVERQVAVLTASQKALCEQKEVADKAAEQHGVKLREAVIAREKLKAELAEVRGELVVAMSDVDGQKQAVATARAEAERQAAAFAASQKALREQNEAADKAAERHRRQIEQHAAKLRAVESERDKLKSEIGELCQQLEVSKADAEAKGQATAAARADAERQKAALAASEKILRGQKVETERAAQQYKRQIEENTAKVREAGAEREKVKAECEKLSEKLQERFEEIAKLTELLQAVEIDSAAKVKELADARQSQRGQSADVETLRRQLAETQELHKRRSAEADARKKQLADEAAQAKTARKAAFKQLGQAVMSLLGYSPEQPMSKEDLRLLVTRIRRTGLIDSEWYLGRYNDVANFGMDPVVHYLLFGASEGREPNDAAKSARVGNGADRI